MKQRLLVMNGQKLLQNEQGGQWGTSKVDKAAGIKPGIYDIHLAAAADKARSYNGVILHTDGAHVYQQVGKIFIKHDLKDFAKVPEVGSNSSIKYDSDRAQVAESSMKIGRKLTR